MGKGEQVKVFCTGGKVEDNETRMDENGMGEEWLPRPLFLLAVGLLCNSHTAARLPWHPSFHL